MDKRFDALLRTTLRMLTSMATVTGTMRHSMPTAIVINSGASREGIDQGPTLHSGSRQETERV